MKVPDFVLPSADWPLEDFDDHGTGDRGKEHGSRRYG